MDLYTTIEIKALWVYANFFNYMLNVVRGAYNLSITCILLYLTQNMLIFVTYLIELPLQTLTNYIILDMLTLNFQNQFVSTSIDLYPYNVYC
jgi:hypothetical protein